MEDTSILAEYNNEEKITSGQPLAELTLSPEPKIEEDNSNQNKYPKSSKNTACPMIDFQLRILKQVNEQEKTGKKPPTEGLKHTIVKIASMNNRY